jgi:hypothetical protein
MRPVFLQHKAKDSRTEHLCSLMPFNTKTPSAKVAHTAIDKKYRITLAAGEMLENA